RCAVAGPGLRLRTGGALPMKTWPWQSRSSVPIACLVAVLVICPGTVRANVGPPYIAGQTAAEPVGIKDVAIARERLDIDLRPLTGNGRVHVEAVYYLHNHGAEKALDLLFASGADQVSGFQVSLDEQPVASAPAK